MKIAHLVDDQSMGGVMAALLNFQDPRLTKFGASRTVIVDPLTPSAPNLDDDVIVIHFSVSWRKLPFLLGLRMRNATKRIVLIEHSYTRGFEEQNVPSPLRFRQMLRTTYACVDEVVAVSNGQAHWLSKVVRKGKVTTIPQSRNLERFAAVSPISTEAHEPVTFGAIGRLHEQKGFDDLIAAFRNPALEGARLLIAGEGPMEDRLRALATGATNIDFLGPMSDPAAFYERVQCVVVPSRWEAYGLVASEAMASGRVVVATVVDGLSEQVRGCGQLVAPGDMIALSNAMAGVCALTPAMRKEIGEASRRASLGRYDAMINAWRTHLFRQPEVKRAARASSAAARNPMPIITSPGQ